jgi:hypothetical protein
MRSLTLTRPKPPDQVSPPQYSDFVLGGRFETTEAEKKTRAAVDENFGLKSIATR